MVCVCGERGKGRGGGMSWHLKWMYICACVCAYMCEYLSECATRVPLIKNANVIMHQSFHAKNL